MHALQEKLRRSWRALTLLVARPREEFASQRYTSDPHRSERKRPLSGPMAAFAAARDSGAIFNEATQRVWLPSIAGGDPSSVLDDRVKALGQEIEAKREEAKEKWSAFDTLRNELAESDIDITDDSSEAFKKAEDAHREYAECADELTLLEARREKLWSMTSERNGHGGAAATDLLEQVKDGLQSRETPGARIAASEAYQQLRESGALKSQGQLGNVRLGEMMTREEFVQELRSSVIVTDDAGDSTVRPFIEPQHRGFVEPRFRPLLLLDLITVGETDSDSIDYVVETGFTNAAAPVPEAEIEGTPPDPDPNNTAGLKPQSTITYEKKDEPVRTLAHWVAATKKSLSDVARLRSLVDGRLRRGLADVLEDQIAAGTGLGENLLGIYNTPGIQHQDIAVPLVEAIHKAITKLRLAFFDPTAVGLDPRDWEEIRLMRDASGGAGTGQYLFGPPSQAGATTLWGLPPAIGAQFPENNPLVGDFRVAELYIREGVVVLASDSHADFFVRNLVALLAEMRAGLIVPQPEAFCEVSAP